MVDPQALSFPLALLASSVGALDAATHRRLRPQSAAVLGRTAALRLVLGPADLFEVSAGLVHACTAPGVPRLR